ncbi:MAG: DNA recombination protein RmuC [Flavobacteriales bacterium]|nr:DNA recombination protein RmuC [Flavobacteriales bacterium]
MNLELISLLIGAGAGLLITWVIFSYRVKSASSANSTELAILEEKLKQASDKVSEYESKWDELNRKHQEALNASGQFQARLEASLEVFRKKEEEIGVLKSTLEQKNDTISVHFGRIQQLEAQNQSLSEKLGTLKQEMDEARKLFENEFKNMAQSILEEKTQKFTELNKQNLDSILKPLTENLKEFKSKVEETYDRESKERFSLGERVKELLDINLKIGKEASDLTKALKGDSKVQGQWGEMILERILEKSGLQEGREYTIQESFKDDDGQQHRTDVVINYPDDRKVVIDSKVSLVDYEKFANSEEPEEQKRHLKDHIRSIKNHIDGLSLKRYEKLVKSLDFTMMFIPIEPAYLLAVKEDEELWHYAYNKRILLISPTHLISAIKMIADLWKRDDQSKNAEEIARRGGLLYDKFVGFVDNLDKIGRNLKMAENAYDDAMKQLNTGKGNLVMQAEKLKQMGSNTSKQLNVQSELPERNDEPEADLDKE